MCDGQLWCVVTLCAKYFVISKQNDFEANERCEAIYFSKRIYERRHKMYYKTKRSTYQSIYNKKHFIRRIYLAEPSKIDRDMRLAFCADIILYYNCQKRQSLYINRKRLFWLIMLLAYVK